MIVKKNVPKRVVHTLMDVLLTIYIFTSDIYSTYVASDVNTKINYTRCIEYMEKSR